MRLRILHVNQLMAMGGAEKQLVELMRQLQPHAAQHLAIVYPESRYPFFYRAEVQALDIPVTFLDKHPGKLARIPALWRYWRVLRRFQPHLIHAHQWHAMDIARAYHRRFGGAPVIANPHTIIADTARAAVERYYVHDAARVVTVSHAAAEQYRALVPSSDVVAVENGIDTAYFCPGRRSPDDVFPEVPRDARIALFAGRIAPEKNLIALLQAVAHLIQHGRWASNWHVVCIGRVDDAAYAAELRHFVEKNNLNPFAHFLDETHDIRACYHACDFLILPSHHEGMGNVVLEAAACERPALVSEAVNLNRVVKPDETSWVFPTNDAGALASQIEKICALPPDTLKRMGAAAREHITQHYTVERMAAEYLSLYQDLLK